VPSVLITATEFGNPDTISVSDLLAQLSITDIEQSQFGIAITFADENDGVWQYQRTDIAGHPWTDFQAGDPGNTDANPIPVGEALLLDPNTIIRFVPNVGFSGTPVIAFRVWDQSIGTASNPPSTTPDNSGGTAPAASSTLSSAQFLASIATDNDGDGVPDDIDVDDDNDGILDVDEIAAAISSAGATDSGIDGSLLSNGVAVSFGITSADLTDPNGDHVLDSITIAGTTYTDFIVPDSYDENFPAGANVTFRQDGSTAASLQGSPDWNAEILHAFR
jgi:hypothetical protein